MNWKNKWNSRTLEIGDEDYQCEIDMYIFNGWYQNTNISCLCFSAAGGRDRFKANLVILEPDFG